MKPMANVMLFDGCVGYSSLLVQGGVYTKVYMENRLRALFME